MSQETDILVGLGGGAVIVAASRQAGLSAWETLAVGAGPGVILALTPRARAGGLALAVGTAITLLALSGSQRVSARRELRRSRAA